MRSWLAAVLLFSLASACRSAPEPAGVPLYPNAHAAPRPRSQLAQVAGPISRIDGRDVVGLGQSFDVLPGCHVVEVDPYVSVTRLYTGRIPGVTYALRTKPGARYEIRREIYTELRGQRQSHAALEEDATGALTLLPHVQTPDDIHACKQWETAAR